MATQEVTPASSLPVYHDQNELREAFRKLWRRRGLIFATMAVLISLGGVRLSQIAPRYEATAMILIDPRPSNAISVDAMLGGGARDAEAIYTEASVLSSRELIGKLVDRMDLEKLPEFNGSLRPPGLMQTLNPMNFIPKGWRNAVQGKPADVPSDRQQVAQRDGLIDAILGHLQISPKPRTRILTVTFDSTTRKPQPWSPTTSLTFTWSISLWRNSRRPNG